MSAVRADTIAYDLGSADMVQDVALYLREITTEACGKSKKLPRPLTDDAFRQSNVLPENCSNLSLVW